MKLLDPIKKPEFSVDGATKLAKDIGGRASGVVGAGLAVGAGVLALAWLAQFPGVGRIVPSFAGGQDAFGFGGE